MKKAFNLIYRKKGVVGTTITWIPATLIIFFIVMVFLFFSSGIASKKFVESGKINSREVFQEKIEGADIYSLNSILAFSNSPVDSFKVYEFLIRQGDKEKFKEKGEAIFYRLYPTKISGWSGTQLWWISLLDYSEDNSAGNSLGINYHVGGWDCQTEEDSVVYSIYFGKKKFVFCIENIYLNNIKLGVER